LEDTVPLIRIAYQVKLVVIIITVIKFVVNVLDFVSENRVNIIPDADQVDIVVVMDYVR
jgi:hypothetical protein